MRYFGEQAKFYEVQWILEHDLSELWIGDPPFPAKVRFPTLGAAHREAEITANAELDVIKPDMSLPAARRVKACDLLQMHLFGVHEVRMGNSYARPIARDALTEAIKVVAGDDYAVRQINKFVEDHRE
jgi:5'-deoxynucleotidase YfbR-like HD superfamily hydrolase